MDTILFRPIPVSRAAWLRVADALFGAARVGGSMLRRAWQSLQASRRRAAELRALRQLSPRVLRDIGVEPAWVNEAQRWCDEHHANRDSFLRNL
jgi:uncharacterized protein YjiS (DUF1127 family)